MLGEFGGVRLIPPDANVPIPPVSSEGNKGNARIRETVLVTPKGDIIPQAIDEGQANDKGKGKNIVAVDPRNVREGIAGDHPLQNYTTRPPDSIDNEDAQMAGIPGSMKDIMEANGNGDVPAAVARDVLDKSEGSFSTRAPEFGSASGGYMYSDGTAYDPILQRQLNFFNMNRAGLISTATKNRGIPDPSMQYALENNMNLKDYMEYLRSNHLHQSAQTRRRYKKEIAAMESVMLDLQAEIDRTEGKQDENGKEFKENANRLLKERIESLKSTIKYNKEKVASLQTESKELRKGTLPDEILSKIRSLEKYRKYGTAIDDLNELLDYVRDHLADNPEHVEDVMKDIDKLMEFMKMDEWRDSLKSVSEGRSKGFDIAVAGEVLGGFMTELSAKFKAGMVGDSKELHYEFNRILEYYKDRMTDQDALTAFTRELVQLFGRYNDNYEVRKVLQENMSDIDRIYEANKIYTEMMQRLGELQADEYNKLLSDYSDRTTPYMSSAVTGPLHHSIKRRIEELKHDQEVIGGAAAHFAKLYRMMSDKQIQEHNAFVEKLKTGRLTADRDTIESGLRLSTLRIPTTALGHDTRSEEGLESELGGIKVPGAKPEAQYESIKELEDELENVMKKVRELGAKDPIRPTGKKIEYEEEIEDLYYHHVQNLENLRKWLGARGRSLNELVESENDLVRIENECTKLNVLLGKISGTMGVELPYNITRTKEQYLVIRYYRDYMKQIHKTLKDLIVHTDGSTNAQEAIAKVRKMKQQITLLRGRINSKEDTEWIEAIDKFTKENEEVYAQNLLMSGKMNTTLAALDQAVKARLEIVDKKRQEEDEKEKKEGRPEVGIQPPEPLQPELTVTNKPPEEPPKQPEAKPSEPSPGGDVLEQVFEQTTDKAFDAMGVFLDQAEKALENLENDKIDAVDRPILQMMSSEELLMRMEPSPRMNVLVASMMKNNPDSPLIRSFVKYHLLKRKQAAMAMDEEHSNKMFSGFYSAMSSVMNPEQDLMQRTLQAISTKGQIEEMTPQRARELETFYNINKKSQDDLNTLTAANMMLDVFDNPDLFLEDDDLAKTAFDYLVSYDDGGYNLVYDTFAMRVAQVYALKKYGKNTGFNQSEISEFVNVYMSAQGVIKSNMQTIGAQGDFFAWFKSMLRSGDDALINKVLGEVKSDFDFGVDSLSMLAVTSFFNGGSHIATPNYFRDVTWKMIRDRWLEHDDSKAFKEIQAKGFAEAEFNLNLGGAPSVHSTQQKWRREHARRAANKAQDEVENQSLRDEMNSLGKRRKRGGLYKDDLKDNQSSSKKKK